MCLIWWINDCPFFLEHKIIYKTQKDGLNKKNTTSQMSMDTQIQFNLHQNVDDKN